MCFGATFWDAVATSIGSVMLFRCQTNGKWSVFVFAGEQSSCLASKQRRSNGSVDQAGQRKGGARPLLRKTGILPAGR